MSEFVQTRVAQGTGIITLDRPRALNSLSLDMVRALAATLLAWRDDARAAADWDYDLPGEWTGHLKTGLTYVSTGKGVNKRNGTALATAQLNRIGAAGLRSGMTSNLPISNLDMGSGWPKSWSTWDSNYFYNNFDPNTYNPASAFTPVPDPPREREYRQSPCQS